jgi:aspartyl-tRNA(Asn)/glutamyl-tRNA(Gln) amidotransferase subunit A
MKNRKSQMLPPLLTAADDIRQGRRTPLDLVDQCLARIDQLEDRIRAWVFVDRDGARAEAERLTRELKAGTYRGPLHGIPLGIKDIFDVFDWPTAAGSRLWTQSIARQDSTCVRRWREAGAIFLGKTVTTQYASFDPPPTRNPWKLDRTPGGSSSGSAAAVACGMCLGAIASQTGGSITRPASFCGVPACKPTYGRVSCFGVVPLAGSMDHPGTMANSVRDVAVLLQLMAGPDPLDPVCDDRPVPDYMTVLSRPIAPPRLGRLRGLFEEQADAVTKTMLEKSLAALTARGATIVDVALPPAFGDVLARHRIVMAVEAAMFHESRLTRHPDDYDPNIRKLLGEGLACSAAEYGRTKEHQRALKESILTCFRDVDALIVPATRGPAPDAATTGDPAFNSPWSYTGLPSVSFPSAWTPEGLPLGLQVIGKPWSEAELFPVAAWCEDCLEVERRAVS